MIKLLSILSIILAIILFPPAVLAVLSNNAVPGDGTYPIKRSLEDGIFAIASLNPTSKAWFSAARSDRRFKELSTLLAQGKSASNTLNELVTQTEIAATQITQVTNINQKEKLIEQLSQSIIKYDEKLQQVTPTQPLTTPKPTSMSTFTPAPTPEVTPVPMPIGKLRPTPTPEVILPPKPIPSVPLIPSPTTLPSVPPDQDNDVDRARKRLEEIKKRLEEDRKKVQMQELKKDGIDKKHEKSGEDKSRENNDRDKKDD